MQLISDAICVLGSRHGLLLHPAARRAGLIRFDRFEDAPEVHLRAGVRIGGKTVIFPLAPLGPGDCDFDHLDQRSSAAGVRYIGLDGASGLRVELSLVHPFRPRDEAFSTTPVLGLRLRVNRLPGDFRWVRRSVTETTAELFLEISGPGLDVTAGGPQRLDLRFNSRSATGTNRPDVDGPEGGLTLREIPQHDALQTPDGTADATGFRRTVDLENGGEMTVFWATWSAPVLEVHGTVRPFAYTRRFADLDAVLAWAIAAPRALWENAAALDRILGDHTAGVAYDRLLPYTLHSWLINTWWVDRDGRDWFSVWEGSCYFHSTVDVEFTQSPFYLAVWPELLAIQLDFWPEFAKDGAAVAGERGAGTLFLSHDVGQRSGANGQAYPHEMEVEETANWIILAAALARRTGDLTIARRHSTTLEAFLGFLVACDSTGNGVPNVGVANTIDDASPAIQYGNEQVYLGVKTLAALTAGRDLLLALARAEAAARLNAPIETLRATLHDHGWDNHTGHFVTLLRKDGLLTDPWTGKERHFDEIPGWDAAHIYTANGLVPLDLVGFDTGVDAERLRRDLIESTRLCRREFGCVHTNFATEQLAELETKEGLFGVSRNPGWIAMNLLRDLAAFYRGVDLRDLANRYWDWQTTTNSRECKLFFETFGGNNLNFYPRGLVAWGVFDALGGLVIDRTRGLDQARPALPGTRVPRLFDADWVAGTCQHIEN